MSFFRGPKIVTDGLILYLDSANSKSYNESENLLLYSSNIGATNGSYISGGTPIVTLNTQTAPDNTLTGTLIDQNGNSVLNYVYTQTQILAINTIYTYSIHIKIGTNTIFNVALDENNFGGKRYLLSYNFGNNTISTSISGVANDGFVINSGYENSINGWVRIFITFKTSSTNVGGLVDMISRFSTGNGTVYTWGRQIEKKPTMSDYTPTTNSIIYPTTTWVDISKNNNCTINGDVYKDGSHMFFSGDSDYVFVGTSASTYNNLNQITLESWCYPMRSSSYEYLFSNDRDCCGVYNGYSIRINNGISSFQIWNSATSGNSVVNSSTSISLNNWYHICATYDMNQLKIYVNGTLMGTTNSTLGIGTPSSFDLKIGAMGLSSIYEYQGYIDISKIYSRALSLTEIQQNYNALKSRFGH